jgi:ABC-2 type transport system ATP-binding protein
LVEEAGISAVIAIRDLGFSGAGLSLHRFGLEVRNGEIFFLLSSEEGMTARLFGMAGGFLPIPEGAIAFDGEDVRPWRAVERSAFLEKISDKADFETEASLGDWLDFMIDACSLSREACIETLVRMNFSERDLKKRVREVEMDVFKMVYLAVEFARDRPNVVIHDFCRGGEKNFEFRFDRLLVRKRDEGKAILYLTEDIFYAAQIADRIGFIKRGQLLFEATADDLREMDIQQLHTRFLT